eukprot:Clim_evm11s49 gene=Clim_evmTU11s49
MSADLPKRAQKLGVDVLTLEDGVPLGPECGLHGPMLPFREWIPKKGRNDDGRSAHLRVKRARLDCNAGEFATCRYYYGCSADRDLSAESGRHKTRVCLKDGLSLLNRSGRGPEPPQWTLGEALPTDLLVHVAAIVDGSKEGVFGWCPVCGRVCGVKVTHGKRKQSHCHCERCHSGKVIKRLDAMKAEKDPLDLYRLVDYNTDEGSMAQYICSDESVGDIVTVIDHLPKPVKRIWCVGTPSIHSAIQKSVRDHKNGSRDLQSILLDLDPIYGVMFPPTFVRINAANGCVWMPAVEDKDAGDGMARLKAMGPPDLVVVDPPFSAPLPAYADGLRKIVRAVEHEHGPVQLLLILPEFLFEKARAGFADDLGIVDYRVTYRNHKKYGKVEQTPETVLVGTITNDLPGTVAAAGPANRIISITATYVSVVLRPQSSTAVTVEFAFHRSTTARPSNAVWHSRAAVIAVDRPTINGPHVPSLEMN